MTEVINMCEEGDKYKYLSNSLHKMPQNVAVVVTKDGLCLVLKEEGIQKLLTCINDSYKTVTHIELWDEIFLKFICSLKIIL